MSAPAPLLDAHLHLHDARLRPFLDEILAELRRLGIARWVVNGTRPADWPDVARLAAAHPEVLPCYGLHPWHVNDRPDDWEPTLTRFLDHENPVAVGEIGLDKWIRDHDLDAQESVLRTQLGLAAERGLPVVIHCLQAWGRLLEILKSEPLDPRGFLLHSFAGPRELLDDFLALGARFSFSGYFLQPRKSDVLALYREIPLDRLLVETDAPDMLLPEDRETHPLSDPATGDRLNHPANLPAIYAGLAAARSLSVETLAASVAENFAAFFGIQPA